MFRFFCSGRHGYMDTVNNNKVGSTAQLQYTDNKQTNKSQPPAQKQQCNDIYSIQERKQDCIHV